MTRGKEVTLDSMKEFIKELNISENDKNKLLELTPENYVGLAKMLADGV